MLFPNLHPALLRYCLRDLDIFVTTMFLINLLIPSKMATKTLLVVLALALIAVALAASLDEQLTEDLSETLSLDDFEEYFHPLEKRGNKVGRKSILYII